MGIFRFDQSACERSSVAEATGGKVNLGYSREEPLGERSTRVVHHDNLNLKHNNIHDSIESDGTEKYFSLILKTVLHETNTLLNY